MEAAATLCLLLRSPAEYSGSPSGTSRPLRLDLRSGARSWAGRGPGTISAQGAAGWVGAWAGGGGLVGVLLTRPLSTPPTISLQRNVGKSVGFVFVWFGWLFFFFFPFPAMCRVLRPRARAAHTLVPTPARGPGSDCRVGGEDPAAAAAPGTHLSAPAS